MSAYVPTVEDDGGTYRASDVLRSLTERVPMSEADRVALSFAAAILKGDTEARPLVVAAVRKAAGLSPLDHERDALIDHARELETQGLNLH